MLIGTQFSLLNWPNQSGHAPPPPPVENETKTGSYHYLYNIHIYLFPGNCICNFLIYRTNIISTIFKHCWVQGVHRALHCNENHISIFLFQFPHMMGLWAIYIFPWSIHIFFFSCSRIGISIMGIYKSRTDTWMWKLGLWPRNSFSGNIFFQFLVLVLCSVQDRVQLVCTANLRKK